MSKKNRQLSKKNRQSASVSSGNKKLTERHTGSWSGMTNWLVILAFVLPLLFSSQTLDPTISTRYIFLAVFAGIFILVFYIWRKRATAVRHPKIRVFFALGLGYGIWSIVCLFNAVNIAESFYPVSRHFLQLILLFIIMNVVIDEESGVLKICKAIMLMSIIQSMIGIFQFYEWGFESIPGNYVPYGLMANRNLFGSAQMLVIPFTLYTLYKASKGWKTISLIALVGIVVSLFLSQTRSAWLGGLFILFGSLALVLFYSKENRKQWLFGTVTAIIVITLIGVLLIQTDQKGVLATSIKERALSISGGNVSGDGPSIVSKNINERIKIWKSTLLLIEDHLITGVGPGNWKISIPAYASSDMVWAEGRYVPDEPHNVYLHIAAETGIPGAVLFFSGWILLAFIGFSIISKTGSADKKILVILILVGLGALAIDSMFSFPLKRIEHSLYMLFMSGIILGCYSASHSAEKSKVWYLGKKVWIASVLVVVLNLVIGNEKYNLEWHANKAKAYENAKMYSQVLVEINKGLSRLVTLDVGGSPLEMYSGVANKELKNYPAALEDLNKAKRLAPNNAKVYINLGTVYTDMKDYAKAIPAYKQALKYAPKFEVVYKNLAVNYYNIGDYSKCIEAISHIDTGKDSYFISLLNDARANLAAQAGQK